MNPTHPEASVDAIQQRLAEYASTLTYEQLSSHAIHAAKLRIADTLGALLSGYDGEPCRISRKLAARVVDPSGATVIGSRIKTTPEMAALANATTARQVNFTDTYSWPNSAGGHPSDVITPVLAAAEHSHASGRDFLLGVVLGYEVFICISDLFHNAAYDYTTFGCLASAIGAGRMLNLSPRQFSHCISLAVVPNSTLRQTRLGNLTMWKAAASGQAALAGVLAALLAREGMEGAHLPFTGKAGWCSEIAREQFELSALGNEKPDTPFRIADSAIKLRPCVGLTMAAVFAAEKAAPLKEPAAVKSVVVETYARAVLATGSGAHHWNPESPETADHSIPFLVAAALLDGAITPQSYEQANLANPQLRALMQKIQVVANEDFTRRHSTPPAKQCARITIEMHDGVPKVSEVAYSNDNSSPQHLEALVVEKFRTLVAPVLGTQRANTILERLQRLEDIDDVAEIPAALVIG